MALKDILPGKIGFGAAPLGNMFRDIPEAEAIATVEAAWNQGIRYFDNAPLYGAGLAEIRMGEALAGKPRKDYVISTKVGRVILDEVDPDRTGEVFRHGRHNRVLRDYSADATLRSIEDSLERLETDHIEIVWVHDVAQDHYGDDWLEAFESARKGAFRTLDRLRDEGVIKAWGLGVNRVEPIEILLALDEPRPDGFLLAGRYTLLDHDRALQRVMPQVAERGLGLQFRRARWRAQFRIRARGAGNPRQGRTHQGPRRSPRRKYEGRGTTVLARQSGGCGGHTRR